MREHLPPIGLGNLGVHLREYLHQAAELHERQRCHDGHEHRLEAKVQATQEHGVNHVCGNHDAQIGQLADQALAQLVTREVVLEEPRIEHSEANVQQREDEQRHDADLRLGVTHRANEVSECFHRSCLLTKERDHPLGWPRRLGLA